MSIILTGMAISATLMITLAIAFCLAPLEAYSKFLLSEAVPNGSSCKSKSFEEDIMNSLASWLGCGGEAGPEKTASIRQTLSQMWRTVPKIASDRIDRLSLRYLVNRYFVQTYKKLYG